MTDWVINFVETGNYWAIALLMFLENVVPPIPSEVIMPLGGFTAKQGSLNVWLVWLAGTVGSVVGQLPLYYAGRVVGEDRLKRWAGGWAGWLGLKPSDIDTSKGWFDRHGGKTVLLCRFVPGVRSFISIPAGMAKMNVPVFLLYSAIGMGIWAATLTAAGWLLGDQWNRVRNYLGPAAYVVFGIVAVTIIGFVIYRKTRDTENAGASPVPPN